MKELGFGFDCSSIPELIMSRQVGGRGEEIMFTSNNTTEEEFLAAAAEGGCILNLDDISLIAKVPEFPEAGLLPLQPRPAPNRQYHYRQPGRGQVRHHPRADHLGVQAWPWSGAPNVSACTPWWLPMNGTTPTLSKPPACFCRFPQMVEEELGIRFEFINIGGGLGIPYKPEDKPLDLDAMAAEITALVDEFQTGASATLRACTWRAAAGSPARTVF